MGWFIALQIDGVHQHQMKRRDKESRRRKTQHGKLAENSAKKRLWGLWASDGRIRLKGERNNAPAVQWILIELFIDS